MRLMILCTLLLGWAAPAPALAAGAPTAAKTAPTGAKAMLGEWMVLGPASVAHLPLMMEFTLRDLAPSADEMSRAHLSPQQQQQVRDGRERAAANPNDPELISMQAAWIGLQQSRILIGPTTLTTRGVGDDTVMPYRVISDEGIQVKVKVEGSGAVAGDLHFVLPGEGMLMMGPPGEEPLVLRRMDPTPSSP